MSKFINKVFNNNFIMGSIFVFPALVGILVFIVIPTFCSFLLSFMEWDLISKANFVGFQNYIKIFSNPVFIKVILNTFVFAISTSFFAVLIPLFLACILNSKIKCSDFFKTSYFLPFITPMIVIAIVWQWIFDPNIGFINSLFNLNIKWLFDKHFAMPALIIVSVWKLIGYNMLIFLAGLSTLNQSLFEAAKIDGASEFRIFKSITVPLLSPTIFFVVIVTCINSFQVFDLIYMMTEGGPLNSTNVLVYSVYKSAFEYFKVGQASALAYVLFCIIFFLTLLQWKIKKNDVYVEE